MVENRAIYLQWQTDCKSYDLSIGAIFNDLERLLIPISRSCHYLTLRPLKWYTRYRHCF